MSIATIEPPPRAERQRVRRPHYTPTLAAAQEMARRGKLIPVARTILADMETPVSAYRKIARGSYSFLLESVEGGERVGRYSFIGCDPSFVLRFHEGQAQMRRFDALGASSATEERSYTDPLDLIRDLLHDRTQVAVPGLPRFVGGLVGYIGYETVCAFERLPVAPTDDLQVPNGLLLGVDSLVAFDHVQHAMHVIALADTERTGGDVRAAYQQATNRIETLISRLHGPAPPLPGGHPAVEEGGARDEGCPTDPPPGVPLASDPRVVANMSETDFLDIVARAKEYVAAGDIIQVVPSQRLSRRLDVTPFNVYRALRMVNPSSYMYYLHLDDMYLVGASPETMVQVEDGYVRTRPIAGTRPRGATPEEDQALAEELLGDEKERAEHIMLVDLFRNDLGRVCRIGSVHVPDLMFIERYSHVMHIVSRVEGELAAGKTGLDALRSCFPHGTVSGAPKIRAMEIIAELEPTHRGPYAGAVGYFGYDGNLDTAIAIRTLLIKNGTAYVQAGSGVVADSVPALEYQESLNKAAALLRALDLADDLEQDGGLA